MNRKQKIVLLAVIVIIMLMIIFPPVGPGRTTSYNINNPMDIVIGIHIHDQNLGFIFKDYNNISYGFLLMECLFVLIVAGLLIYAFKDSRAKNSKA